MRVDAALGGAVPSLGAVEILGGARGIERIDLLLALGAGYDRAALGHLFAS